MNYRKILKKAGAYALTVALLATSAVAVPSVTAVAFAYPSERKMENLDRGVVAMKVTSGTYISWRRLGTEPEDTVFTLYRNKEKIAEGAITNYSDPDGRLGDYYTVVCNGTMSEPTQVLEDNYIEIPMAETPESDTMITDRNGIYYGAYTPGDGTYADLDGDGQYEIIVLWCPPDAKDAASTGQTGKVFVDAYKLDGTFMWRIDMGYNIRAGAHDTMLMCADFDGDGAAEMILRTADGTTDAEGNVIGDASKGATYEDSWAALNAGKNLQGPLYVTCFDGETGVALDTIDYYPNNTINSLETCYSFGDDFGNRCERYNSTIAYLDGNLPSVVMGRGYYFGKNGRQRQAAAAYDFRNGKLSLRWCFDTETGYDGYKSGNENYVGQGNHQLEAADVDGDGKDEVTTGPLWYDDDGTVLWSSQLEHGDVVHVGDFDPTIDGLEVMTAKEDYSAGDEHFQYSNPVLTAMGIQDALGADNEVGEQVWGILLQSASDGHMIQVVNGTKDTGRGMIGNIGYGDSYYVMWGAASTGYHDNEGNKLSDLGLSMNGRIYWDGDLQDELQDHMDEGQEIVISKWNDNTKSVENLFVPEGTHSINSTKGNHNGQGDIIGDWREEFVSYVITESSTSTSEIEVPANWDKTITAEVERPVYSYALRVYTTNIPTEYNFYTLAHDDVYRNTSATYNNCYNQPPHISWYMNDHIDGSTYTTQPESHAVLVSNKYTAKTFDESLLPEAGEYIASDNDTTDDGTSDVVDTTPAEPGDFTDTLNYWARSTIKEMAVAGIIDGMGDGTFNPDGSVTKCQFIKLVVTAMGLPVSGSYSSHWAEPYVNVANSANILSKNIDVSNLDAAMSREEMASLIARAAEYKGLSTSSSSKTFTDSDSISSWAASDVATATSAGIINGYDDGSFRPASAATRAEAATMLSRFYNAMQ
ncbi:MAG: S-layer homology domain-containing protein [Firmicutes bacterium]|nr:S-layer homology domain-containing protein [Bacillota bacterium]